MTVTQPDTLSKVGKLARTISSAGVMENKQTHDIEMRDEEGIRSYDVHASHRARCLPIPAQSLMMPTNTLTGWSAIPKGDNQAATVDRQR